MFNNEIEFITATKLDNKYYKLKKIYTEITEEEYKNILSEAENNE